MAEQIKDRIRELRKKLKEYDAQWYLTDTADPHNSEYINDHYKEREFLSGFTGSAGTLLIGDDIALLWTDGRYFVQAVEELMDTGIIRRDHKVYGSAAHDGSFGQCAVQER